MPVQLLGEPVHLGFIFDRMFPFCNNVPTQMTSGPLFTHTLRQP